MTSEVQSWRRPREINPKSALFVGGSCDSDVVQGALGDCWFLAALCGTGHLRTFIICLMTNRRVRAVVATRHDLMQQLFVSCHPEHGLCVDPPQYALVSFCSFPLSSHPQELVPAIRSASGRRSSGWYVVCALVEVTRPTPCNARTHHTGGDHRRQDSVRLSGPSGLRQMPRSYVRFASLRR